MYNHLNDFPPCPKQKTGRKLRDLLRGKNIRKIAQQSQAFQIRVASRLRSKPFACLIAGKIRNYSVAFVVAFCVLLVVLINLSSRNPDSGNIFTSFTSNSSGITPLKNRLTTEASRKNNLATAPLMDSNTLLITSSQASGLVSREDFYLADDYEKIYQSESTIDKQVIVASIGPQTPVAKEKRGTKTYEVKPGDTVSTIAAAYGISTSTILSANNLSEGSLLKPGDKLTILPITGVSYKVQKGDSLETIAKKYNVDTQKIIAHNELTADGKLKEGQTLILPDGYLSPTRTTQTTTANLAIARQPSTISSITPIRLVGGGTGHRFPYGYCTWYVAQRRYIPWGGNAISWLANARAYGKAIGKAPRPGAIVVTTESRWGHVALVESVNGSSFTISEMNYTGFGKKSTRTLSANSPVVRGFIY